MWQRSTTGIALPFTRTPAYSSSPFFIPVTSIGGAFLLVYIMPETAILLDSYRLAV
jgi:hypothetical protein